VQVRHAIIITTSATLFAILLSEFIFRFGLAYYYLPKNEKMFFSVMRDEHPHFRYSEFPSRDKGYRILGLGDSFGVMGSKEKRNFFDIMGQKLNAQRRDSEVINISISCIQPIQEFRLLNEFGLKFEPDVVVHNIFVGNDLDGVAEGRPASVAQVPLYIVDWSLETFLQPKSWVLFSFLDRARPFFEEIRKRENEQDDGSFSKTAFLAILGGYKPHFHRDFPVSLSWKEARRAIQKSIRLAKEHHIRYVMTIAPDQLQVERRYQNEVFGSTGADPEEYDLALPQKLLMELAEEEGVPAVDLLNSFLREGSQGGLYLSRDTHWNDKGNALAAKVILEHIDFLGSSTTEGRRVFP
jgi:hypothetical protein